MGLEVGDGVAFLKQSGTTQRSSASLVEGNPPTVYDSFSDYLSSSQLRCNQSRWHLELPMSASIMRAKMQQGRAYHHAVHAESGDAVERVCVSSTRGRCLKRRTSPRPTR